MALLSVQQASLDGKPITYGAAGAGGDTFPVPHGAVALRVKNGSGSAMTATLAFPGNTAYGVANPAKQSASIAAGAEVVIGPIPQAAVDTSTGVASVSYSSATSVTVAVVGH
ncbi:hypothetical protein [Phycicoccus avicenniae]|uniref:hypothetical protein n=1 Tax=Phycicoccus avicenniae TaxID=2828860 RepID=UPI003D2A1453